MVSDLTSIPFDSEALKKLVCAGKNVKALCSFFRYKSSIQYSRLRSIFNFFFQAYLNVLLQFHCKGSRHL